MSDLSVRQDDYSVQITSPASQRFFVRVADPDMITTKVRFTDFLLESGSEKLSEKALDWLHDNIGQISTTKVWVFSDLLPKQDKSPESDHLELVRRFDAIRSIIDAYCAKHGRTIENSSIEPAQGKFDGHFHLTETAKASKISRLRGLLGRSA